MRSSALLCALLLTSTLADAANAQTPALQPPPPAPAPTAPTILRTAVRRVLLDVVVTDPKAVPVSGLTASDFRVTEDGQAQQIVSFDANGFSPEMEYLPPALPSQPANTFINLPTTPEKGPLYILLYDLVNMDSPDQMGSPEDHHIQSIARQQMIQFIQSKPEGARFAIFVRTDGLHLIQGFTSDKSLLYRAIDPHSPMPHIPTVFLMAPNFGQGDRISALRTLHALVAYLDGLPGRKNLLWFSSAFPVSLFAEDSDGPNFQEETKATLDLLERNQIAVYPVDARGVALEDSHAQLTNAPKSPAVGSPPATSGQSANAVTAAALANAPVQGESAVMSSYSTMDELARETGGRAFYSDNNVAGELLRATASGSAYYTLTYAATNTDYDGKLRKIHVELAKKGYELAYRRFYYGTESPQPDAPATPAATAAPGANPSQPDAAHRPPGDTLSADMQHGAPTAHQLVFVVQAHQVGAAAPGTPEQMAELATEPAYFRSRRKSAALKPLPPVPLQRHVFSFAIPTRQFKQEPSLNLELAIAAFDADGRMMNAVVRVAKKDLDQALGANPGANDPPRFFRVEQELEVPLAATSLRFAVRDTTNDRIGAMEIQLPLASESDPAPKNKSALTTH